MTLEERLKNKEVIIGFFTDNLLTLRENPKDNVNKLGQLVAIKDGKFIKTTIGTANTVFEEWNNFVEVGLKNI